MCPLASVLWTLSNLEPGFYEIECGAEEHFLKFYSFEFNLNRLSTSVPHDSFPEASLDFFLIV